MLPALGVVSTKYPELIPFLTALKEIIEVRDGRIGDPLERFVTLRDLAGVDLLNVARVGRQGTVLSPGSGVGQSAPDLTVPPVATGLTASGAIQSVILDWTDALTQYGNHSYTEIWRSDTDDLGAAVLVGQSPSFVWVDSVETGQTKYYWIRFVSTANIVGPFNSVAGTPATTGFLLTGDLADLAVEAAKLASGAVDDTKLADGAVTATKIANLAVGSAAIANLAVATGHIQDAAIVNAKIGNLAVDSAKIADAAIVNAKIANLAVTTAKIADANITTAKIANAAITNALIANAAIGTANIIDANITTLKIAGQAVTIPSAAYTAGEYTLNTSYSDAQSITYTSTGAPATIFFSAVARASTTNGCKMDARLLENGVVIYQSPVLTMIFDGSASLASNITRTPPVGPVT
jgi:hypothetical protein